MMLNADEMCCVCVKTAVTTSGLIGTEYPSSHSRHSADATAFVNRGATFENGKRPGLNVEGTMRSFSWFVRTA